MKIEFITRTDDRIEDLDGRDSIEIKIDGVRKFIVRDGEPEDATLRRDFKHCYSVVNLMKLAFEAGKRGEDFEVEYIESEGL